MTAFFHVYMIFISNKNNLINMKYIKLFETHQEYEAYIQDRQN